MFLLQELGETEASGLQRAGPGLHILQSDILRGRWNMVRAMTLVPLETPILINIPFL